MWNIFNMDKVGADEYIIMCAIHRKRLCLRSLVVCHTLDCAIFVFLEIFALYYVSQA